MSIELVNVSRRFGDFVALDGIDLAVGTGELVAVLGPSGSGKTSLLRIVAGLDPLDEGAVRLHGDDVTTVPARERRVGFVFQHYALFAHMTVAENVAFGLTVQPRCSRPARAEIDARVAGLLARVELDTHAHRYPHQLSGGQRQRVALARALAVAPRVLLLDEPFGALDARVRQELRGWLRRLHDELAITSLLVTHDQAEALDVADRIVVLNRGRIEQVGDAQDLTEQPASHFVREFLLHAGPRQNARCEICGNDSPQSQLVAAGD